MENVMERPRKSEKMTKDEHRLFIKYVHSFPTKIDAAFALNLSRPTLDSLIFKGSGKPETIRSVREKLQGAA